MSMGMLHRPANDKDNDHFFSTLELLIAAYALVFLVLALIGRSWMKHG